MSSNNDIIESLRKCFDTDETGRFSNCALVFAYNGTGKTRLSYDFAHYGREKEDPQHTLYYNAYTEDLFTWNNDHENNTDHYLEINQNSRLIRGLAGLEFAGDLRKYLHLFTDIDFDFDYADDNPDLPPCSVRFSKTTHYQQELNGEMQVIEDEVENIKISRGEERLFVWCFFRCIIDQVLNGNEAYKNIEYIYIDDPMSSLDDNNVVAFGEQLYSVIRKQLKQEVNDYTAGKNNIRRIKFVVSSHHALFFHTMIHGLNADKKLSSFFLNRNKETDELSFKKMDDETPFYYNVAMMAELQKAVWSNKLYTYHFNILRSVMDKIREFFGHPNYRFILNGITYGGYTLEEGGPLSQEELTELYSRIVNVFSHQAAMFSFVEMNEDNKKLAKSLFYHIKNKYMFQLPDLENEMSEKEIYFAKKASKIKKTK